MIAANKPQAAKLVVGNITYYGEADAGYATSEARWRIYAVEGSISTMGGTMETTKFPIGYHGKPSYSPEFKWDDVLYLNYSYIPDAAAPTLSTVTIASNNTDTTKAKVGDVVTITIVANEFIENIVATIAGKSAAVIPGADPKHFTLTYTMETGDTEGVVPFVINYTDIGQIPGAEVTETTNASSVTFNKTAPVAMLEYSTDGGSNYYTTVSVKNADTLTIKATFSEEIMDSPIVKLAIDNSVLSAANMTKVDTTHYTYTLDVPAGDVSVATCSLSVGKDSFGNVVVAAPTNATFKIDNTAPTLASAERDSNTQITVTLSELAKASTITKANDGGFIVYDGVNPLTTYAVSAIAPDDTNDKVILTVADLSASIETGFKICYAAVGNGTVSDIAGNTMATDSTGVLIEAE